MKSAVEINRRSIPKCAWFKRKHLRISTCSNCWI